MTEFVTDGNTVRKLEDELYENDVTVENIQKRSDNSNVINVDFEEKKIVDKPIPKREYGYAEGDSKRPELRKYPLFIALSLILYPLSTMLGL